MELEVQLDRYGRFRWEMRDGPEGFSVHHVVPTMWQVLQAFVPSLTEARAREAVRTAGIATRGWLSDQVSESTEPVRVLSALGVEVDGNRLCTQVASLMAEHTLTSLRARTGRARIIIPLATVNNNLSVNLPALSLDTPILLSVDGRLYTLRPAGEGDIVSTIRSELEERVSSYRAGLQSLSLGLQAEVERRVAEVEARMREPGQIPSITYEEMRLGLKVHSDSGGSSGGSVFFYLPFHYRPRYIQRGSDRYEIAPELVFTMERRVMVLFKQLRTGWDAPSLFTEDYQYFSHYHDTCWGSLNWRSMITAVPSSLFPLRDLMETELEVVNADSPANRHPEGFPHISQLVEECGEEVTRWNQQPFTQQASQPAQQEVRRGWRI